MSEEHPDSDRPLTTRDHLALGIALFLIVPSIASLIIANRFIGRMMQPSDFLLHYGTASLLFGLVAAFLVKRLAPERTSPGRADRSVRSTRQAIPVLTFLGTAALLLGGLSVMNAVLDRSEGTIEDAVVVQKDRRRLYKRPANYVTVSIHSMHKEISVPDQEGRSLEKGMQVHLLLRKGYLGYEYIEKILTSNPPGMKDEEEDLPS